MDNWTFSFCRILLNLVTNTSYVMSGSIRRGRGRSSRDQGWSNGWTNLCQFRPQNKSRTRISSVLLGGVWVMVLKPELKKAIWPFCGHRVSWTWEKQQQWVLGTMDSNSGFLKCQLKLWWVHIALQEQIVWYNICNL